MIIELYRAWTPEDMQEDTCGACGHRVPATSVRAFLHTDDRRDMGVACPKCIEFLGYRSPERFPTIEVYRELLATYPRPMYESEEELEAATTAAGYEDPSELAFAAAAVWRASASLQQEEEIHIIPTVLYRAGSGTLEAVTVRHEDGHALVVFRSEEEAEKFRAATGKFQEEDIKPVALDLEDLENVLKMHECTHVAMPEAWGAGGADFFEAKDFIGMLEESARA
jgi:hypothetical protein